MSQTLRCGKIHSTIVDDDFVIPHGWRIGYVGGYAELRTLKPQEDGRYRWIPLHRHVMGLTQTSPLVIDHINRDRLDNRRENLRPCTDALNGRNRLAKGVHFDKARRKWLAQVMENRKHIHLGRYETELEAVLAVNDYKKKNWGEFAVLWPIPTEPQPLSV